MFRTIHSTIHSTILLFTLLFYYSLYYPLYYSTIHSTILLDEEAEPDEEGGTDGHGFVAQYDQVTLMADETIEGENPGIEAAPAASVNLVEPSNKRAKKATPAVPTAAPAPSITTELTLTEAFSPFAGLKPVERDDA